MTSVSLKSTGRALPPAEFRVEVPGVEEPTVEVGVEGIAKYAVRVGGEVKAERYLLTLKGDSSPDPEVVGRWIEAVGFDRSPVAVVVMEAAQSGELPTVLLQQLKSRGVKTMTLLLLPRRGQDTITLHRSAVTAGKAFRESEAVIPVDRDNLGWISANLLDMGRRIREEGVLRKVALSALTLFSRYWGALEEVGKVRAVATSVIFSFDPLLYGSPENALVLSKYTRLLSLSEDQVRFSVAVTGSKAWSGEELTQAMLKVMGKSMTNSHLFKGISEDGFPSELFLFHGLLSLPSDYCFILEGARKFEEAVGSVSWEANWISDLVVKGCTH